jgi:4'-phosphopantetheinyl transferase
VVVVVGPRGATDADDRLFLAATVAWALGVDPRTVVIERRCDRCGGSHGKPVVTAPSRVGAGAGPLPPGLSRAGSRPLQASLSRAGSSVAVAVTFAGPVGVDIESVAEVARAGFDDVAFGDEEIAALRGVPAANAAWARAALWTGKEAALKSTGAGLRVDPRDLSLSLPSRGDPAATRVTAWPGAGVPLETLHLARFEAGPGLVGTVAVLTAAVPPERLPPERAPTVRVLAAADIRQRPSGA